MRLLSFCKTTACVCSALSTDVTGDVSWRSGSKAALSISIFSYVIVGPSHCQKNNSMGVCDCGDEEIARVVKKEGPNNGRWFVCCPRPVNPCKHFKWIAKPPPHEKRQLPSEVPERQPSPELMEVLPQEKRQRTIEDIIAELKEELGPHAEVSVNIRFLLYWPLSLRKYMLMRSRSLSPSHQGRATAGSAVPMTKAEQVSHLMSVIAPPHLPQLRSGTVSWTGQRPFVKAPAQI